MQIAAFFIALFFGILNIGTGLPTNKIEIRCPEKINPCTCTPMAYGVQIMCANFNDTHELAKALTNLRTHKVENLVLHNLYLKEVLPQGLFQDQIISEIGVEKSKLIFPQPAFKGLDESLERLNAQNSIIKSTEKFAIAKLTNLNKLRMKENSLGVVKNTWLNGKIPSVQEIELEDNGITEIESRAFADLLYLHTLNLHGNSIKDVKRSMFPKPANNLKSIDLSKNRIESLPEDFFSKMPVLKKVVLSENELKTLDEKTWRPVWSQLEEITILDAPLFCDSSLKWIMKVKRPEEQQLSATCVAPSQFAGMELKDVLPTLT